MGLRDYRRKRDFKQTPEPAGNDKSRRTRRSGNSFVIQKHAASRLHYDFRLEFDGVLKSWAVPKGPSLDPSVKALAVEVEDHPLDYAGFEGVIPKGQYGGGTVMVWDRGDWAPDGDAAAGLKKGHLKFALSGEKINGAWSLVRIARRKSDKNNWLLIKSNDDAARSKSEYDVTVEEPKSVISQRTLEEIAADADRVWQSKPKKQAPRVRSVSRSTPRSSIRMEAKVAVENLTSARKAHLPATFSPELANTVQKIPSGDDWLHEVKFDGYRLLCFLDGKSVRLVTRRGNDWTDRFSALAEAAGKLKLGGTILDGELVSLDKQGISHFQSLQNWIQESRGFELTYFVFDAPYFGGYDIRKSPLIERKELIAAWLRKVSPRNDGMIRYSDHVRGDGPRVLAESCRHGLEGVVSKQANSLYECRRTRMWLKSKCRLRQEFVIGGYTNPQGSREEFGALLVGYRDQQRWVYCGRVGTGFSDDTLRNLASRLRKLERDSPPFDNLPHGAAARGVTWVEPRLVAEVEFAQWTEEGILRHAAYLGLREDKSAREVVKELTMTDSPPKHRRAKRKSKVHPDGTNVAGVPLSSPDRVLYPDEGITKFQLAEYYTEIADWILPFLINRPLTIVRCPQGLPKQCFVQRHWKDSMPKDVGQVVVQEKGEEEPYIVIHDLAGLISLVQINSLELHPWGARIDRIEKPDVMIIDLDPGPGVPWPAIKKGAIEIRDELQRLGLTSFVRTSGGKGLHVVTPLSRRAGWDEVGEFARLLAVGLAARSPKQYVANMRKELRKGRIFIDYVRNRRGATAIGNYSTRARASASVATPIGWDELSKLKSAEQFNVTNVSRRLRSLKESPWEDYFTLKQSITKAALMRVRKL